jgi:hypothetical protein
MSAAATNRCGAAPAEGAVQITLLVKTRLSAQFLVETDGDPVNV